MAAAPRREERRLCGGGGGQWRQYGRGCWLGALFSARWSPPVYRSGAPKTSQNGEAGGSCSRTSRGPARQSGARFGWRLGGAQPCAQTGALAVCCQEGCSRELLGSGRLFSIVGAQLEPELSGPLAPMPCLPANPPAYPPSLPPSLAPFCRRCTIATCTPAPSPAWRSAWRAGRTTASSLASSWPPTSTCRRGGPGRAAAGAGRGAGGFWFLPARVRGGTAGAPAGAGMCGRSGTAADRAT